MTTTKHSRVCFNGPLVFFSGGWNSLASSLLLLWVPGPLWDPLKTPRNAVFVWCDYYRSVQVMHWFPHLQWHWLFTCLNVDMGVFRKQNAEDQAEGKKAIFQAVSGRGRKKRNVCVIKASAVFTNAKWIAVWTIWAKLDKSQGWCIIPSLVFQIIFHYISSVMDRFFFFLAYLLLPSKHTF